MSLRKRLEAVSPEQWVSEQVQIRPIRTQEEMVYAVMDCTLSKEQREMVNPAWFSIGRAYLNPEANVPCLICDRGGEPIGFIMLTEWLGEGEPAYSWSYFVDKARQGQGFGRSAAMLAIRILQTADGEKPIKLATEVDNLPAQRLYRSLGFVQLSEMDGDDLVFIWNTEEQEKNSEGEKHLDISEG